MVVHGTKDEVAIVEEVLENVIPVGTGSFDPLACYMCGVPGHLARDYPVPQHNHKEDGSLGFIRPAQWNTEMFGKTQLDVLGN